ncbi:MAG: CHAT domain-containing protein [Saprospiraceae bacterium]|nr:CHAT domain-containing protein [Saprospiraceae bacterium]
MNLLRPLFCLCSMLYAMSSLSAQPATSGPHQQLSTKLDTLEALLQAEAYNAALPLSDSLLAQAKHLAGDNLLDSLYVRALFTRGRTLFFRGEYHAAISALQDVLPLSSRLYGEESIYVAKTLTNLGICHTELREPGKAIEYHRQALAIYQKQNDPWLPAMADCWNNLANAQADNRDNESALESYEQALHIRYRNEGPNSPGVASIYQNAAGCHLSLGDLEEAIRGYRAALAIFQKSPKPRPVSEAHVWHNLGICHELAGELDNALYCNERALALRQKHLRPDHPHLIASLRGLSTVYRGLGDFDRSELYVNKVMEARRATLKPGNPSLTNALVDAGVVAGDRRDWEKAEAMFQLALQSEGAALKPDSLNIARTLSRYGTLKFKQDLLDSALMLQRRALDFHPVDFSGMDAVRANIFANMAECYLQKQELSLADSFFQVSHALQAKSARGKDQVQVAFSLRKIAECRMWQHRFEEANELLDSVFVILNVADSLNWEQARSPNGLALALIARSRLYLRWASYALHPEYLHMALYWGETALSYMTQWEQKLAASSSRRNTRELAREARELCVVAAYQLSQNDLANHTKWIERAFGHIEAAHNSQLRDVLVDANNKKPLGKIDPAQAKEQTLRNEIAETEKQIYLMRKTGLAEANDTMLRYVNLLFNLKKELDSVAATRPFNPSSTSQPTATRIPAKEICRQGQAFLEYFVTDSVIYIYFANTTTAEIVAVPLNFDLDSCVARLRQGITGYYALPVSDARRTGKLYEQSLEDYANTAHWLYRKLLAPVEPFIGQRAAQSLLIVPDGVLNLVPFNALLKNMPDEPSDFASYSFLANDYHICMAFSAALQREMCVPHTQYSPQGMSLVMAPFFEGDSTLLPSLAAAKNTRFRFDTLHYSGLEAFQIHRTLGKSRVWYGAAAALDTFLRYAPNSRLLHLSTHSVADGRFGEYCYVVFGKDSIGHRRLFVSDIHRQKFQADLVVLSSCESAVGELQPGEGIIGLSRAFAHAGAKSIVSSLWQVNDVSTAELMVGFYDNMVRGKMRKDTALSESCRQYLSDTKRPNELKHPYYWSAFTITGDANNHF